MANLLDQLKTMTTVVSDSGDINSIAKYKPTDSTTNPSLIATAAGMPAYAEIVDDCLKTAREKVGESASDEDVAKAAFKTLAVAFGRKILEIVPGRVSTEVDARLSYDTDRPRSPRRATSSSNTRTAGIDKQRVLIKLASTWEGIKAAEILEKEGIHCNLTLLFGIAPGRGLCGGQGNADLAVRGPHSRLVQGARARRTYKGADDPGVHSVTEIYDYYKKFDYKTVVMGASFRNTGEIIELAGCDLLTIAPKLLEELQTTEGELIRKLDPAKAHGMQIEKITVDKATFDKMHAENQMATDKLKEGIEGFTKALEDLEKQLAKRGCGAIEEVDPVTWKRKRERPSGRFFRALRTR